MRREVALDRCLVSTTFYSRHRAGAAGEAGVDKEGAIAYLE